MQLYLIRHPRPQVPPGICYGQTDLPLAEPAETSAAPLRAALAASRAPSSFGTLTVVSSPLQRCRLLAEALDARTQVDTRLMELNFGDWEQQPWDTIARSELDRWAAAPFAYCPPNGESPSEMAARVIAFAAELPSLAGGGDLVVVAHHGPLRVLAAHLLGLPPSASLRLHFDFARLSCFDLASSGPVLRWHNR